jgi:Cell wall-associated hydrolases (invasion-associated proteins)
MKRITTTAFTFVILLTCLSPTPVNADNLQKDTKIPVSVPAQQENEAIQRALSLQTSVNALQKTVDQNNSLIKQHQARLLDIKKQEETLIAKQKSEAQALASYLRTDYMQGNTSHIDALNWLFGARSLTEILDRMSYIESIIASYQSTREQISKDTQQLKERRIAEQAISAQLLQSVQSKQTLLDRLNEVLAKQRLLIETMTTADQQTLAIQEQTIINDPQNLAALQVWEKELESRGLSIEDQISLIKAEQSTGTIIISEKAAGTTAQILTYAESFLGSPYVWGGTSPTPGFDCSGLVQYVYARFGVNLPRVTWDQYAKGQIVDKADLIPGDLVFFSTYAEGPSHVGIYIGDGLMINDNNRGVSYDSIDNPYWATKYVGARRVIKG